MLIIIGIVAVVALVVGATGGFMIGATNWSSSSGSDSEDDGIHYSN